jgi:hypothetical protein
MLVQAQAHIVDNRVVWLQQPSAPLPPETRVLLVWESAPTPAAQDHQAAASGGVDIRDLAGRLHWRGDALAAQRELRDAW